MTTNSSTVSYGPPQHFIDINTKDSHQTSPGWLLTFLTWGDPSPKDITNGLTLNKRPGEKRNKVNKKKWDAYEQQQSDINNKSRQNSVLVVDSDCVSLIISHGKDSLTGSAQMVLKGGKYNYLATIFPGDYVLVNIKDHLDLLKDIKNRAENLSSPINTTEDGFKGIYKVQSVKEKLSMDENSGTKIVEYHIAANSFTELDNSIYFVPPLTQDGAAPSILNSLKQLSYRFRNITKTIQSVQYIIAGLVELVLGSGPSEEGKRTKTNGLKSPNDFFLLPPKLSSLMGVNGTKFSQIFRYYFGIQVYDQSANKYGHQAFDLEKTKQFSPRTTSNKDFEGFYFSAKPVTGQGILRPEFFNQVSGWSIFKSYQNPIANEMFTSFRSSVYNGRSLVLPTITLRQYPFSSPKIKKTTLRPITPFLSLPRWVISPNMIKNMDIGRDNAARINFVQVFGISYGYGVSGQLIAKQISQGTNVVSDDLDIKRSGLKPTVMTSTFETTNGKDDISTPFWAQLQGDIKIGSHMKLGGTVSCNGIEEPIAIGDNAQIDNIVYHIETVTHECRVAQSGQRIFKTYLGLSHGVDATSNGDFTVYGKRIRDYEEDRNSVEEPFLPSIINEQENI